MDKFWEWMEKYCYCSEDQDDNTKYLGTRYFRGTKKAIPNLALIGYMLQYLADKHSQYLIANKLFRILKSLIDKE